ncbi:MAG TPA: hypothetical protein VFS51_05720, partial [Gemmatimonadales bacterium]|nr:hypothetical protein [Gemmatimonadales bacterium]
MRLGTIVTTSTIFRDYTFRTRHQYEVSGAAMKTSASILLGFVIALGYTDKPADRSAPHAAFAVGSFPIVRTDTGTWADTVRRGDTTFYSHGRIITHVAVLIDSLLVSSATTGSGVPNGPFHLSIDSLCAQERLGYNAALLVASSSGRSLPAQLAKAASCNGRVIVAVSRSKLKDANGELSVAAGVAEIGRWPWAEISRYVDDSTIIGFYAGDDVSADEWGKGVPMATRMARWDSIYGELRWRAPGAATIIRAKPTELASWGYRGINITTAWAQYRGPYRDKEPKTWVAGQVTAAKAQNLGLVIGHNLLDGGCGPAVLANGRMNTACLPNLPGTGILGTTKDAASV